MYDLQTIKAIKCEDVARDYGIELAKKHNRMWGKLRNEATASFSINLKNNLWYDFGSSKGGSVIDLVAELEGITPADAVHKLAVRNGIQSNSKDSWQPLTDSQYKELGIQPERATMNFKFDLDKHAPEQLEAWQKKYSMHVKELAQKYPNTYNKLIRKIALETINNLRKAYNTAVKLHHDLSYDPFSKEYYKSVIFDEAKVINHKVELLRKATTYNNKHLYNNLVVLPERDIKEYEEKAKADMVRANPEEQAIKERLALAYKNLYNYTLIEHFTSEQLKALHDINFQMSQSHDRFLSIESIKELYGNIGKKLEQLSEKYDELKKAETSVDKGSGQFKELKAKLENLTGDLVKVKDLFAKCNTVIDAVREANLSVYTEVVKQTVISKNVVISQEL